MSVIVPGRFKKGVGAVMALKKMPRYEAAFIFGSVAEGTSNHKSDLDVRVIVSKDNPCENINHPSFEGYKLDLTFRSFKQFKEFTDLDLARQEREPNLGRGMILFDKTGELTKLQQKVRAARPPKYTHKDYQFVQFMLYHANDKVERYLEDNPVAALYSMHANIGEVLKIHFKLNGKWWVSSKVVLRDLEIWDQELARLVKDFVGTAEIQVKYAYWSAIVDHVSKPMGGRQPISENNCTCETCTSDLALL